jgi:hypothetical protein
LSDDEEGVSLYFGGDETSIAGRLAALSAFVDKITAFKSAYEAAIAEAFPPAPAPVAEPTPTPAPAPAT